MTAPGLDRSPGSGRPSAVPAAAWPRSGEDLRREQQRLAATRRDFWRPEREPVLCAGCFVCFPRGESGPGRAGDRAWAAAALLEGPRVRATAAAAGEAGAPYEPGLLALREGSLLQAAVAALGERPEVLLVDATARDHPRGAGLALHLGAVLDVPTVGVTHRPLWARGEWPADLRGATSPLVLDGREVARWLRTRAGARPLAIHPGWRMEAGTAIEIVLAVTGRARTPEPLRRARQLARVARARRGAAPPCP